MLHWSKVPPTRVQTSVWKNLPPVDDKTLETEELKKLFTVQPVAKGGAKTEGAVLKEPKFQQLLDLKRSNQINIALVKFKCTHEHLRDGLLRLDEKVIKAEDVGRLRQMMPTTEEVEMLQREEATSAQFGNAEKFLYLMSQVPRLRHRLECFQTKVNFDSRWKDVDAQLNALLVASQCVRGSKQLPHLFHLVLKLGNFLNQDTAKGSAGGFRFDVLQKLGDTKSSGEGRSQVSLLQYLARVAVKHRKDILKLLQGELVALEEAHQPPLTCANIEQEIDGLSRELEAVRAELVHHKEPGFTPADQFAQVMGGYVAEAATKVERLMAKKTKMIEELHATADFLGQDRVESEPEQLLSRLHAFTIAFGKACRDNEREELLRVKQEAAKKAAKESEATRRPGETSTNVRAVVRKKLAVPNHVMASIQGSLRRGDFAQMKQMQAQMTHELAGRLQHRRNSIAGAGDED